MDKLKMQTPNRADENFKKLAALFPNAVTETVDENGVVVRAIDKDVLMQEINTTVVDGKDERYQFTWPDKKKSVLLANAPIAKTLRPCPEESVGKDGTHGGFDSENLYIEGDNLEVLKLLQETYLGKIKMIYIDPPYNTGNDFVYEDDFAQSTEEYLANSGQYDEEGNRLVKNMDTNGRFHTDWLNMIYPRLKLAKDLLSDDGVIFISIDENEQANLTKICDELFGACNRIGPIIQNKQNAKNDTTDIQKNHEYILVYRKAMRFSGQKVIPTILQKNTVYKPVFEDKGKYYYLNDPITTRGEGGTLNARPNLGYTVYYNPVTRDKIAVMDYDISLAKESNDEDEVYDTKQELVQQGYVPIRAPHVRGKLGCWTWALEKFNQQKDSIVITGKNGSFAVRKRTFVPVEQVTNYQGQLQYKAEITSNVRSIIDFSTNDGTNTLTNLFDKTGLFSNPKNLSMITYFLSLVQDESATVLDFFSGSATTAHAVMRLNAEDGGNRKFIMVQLLEETDGKSEAYKAGYKNICEIGKERIRRAGAKIKEENPLGTMNLDVGFRVLKCDTTNMKNVYYHPDEYDANMFDMLEDNIKENRTPEDLLFQVMLDLGVLLSSKIEQTEIAGKKVFNVADNFLIACFDANVTEETITAIAKQKPYYFVMRDSSLANDSVAANFDQIFATYSPETTRKVL